MSKEETKILSHSFTFGKTKERFSSSRLAYHEVERRHTILRFLPQEGARSMGQVYHTRLEKAKEYIVESTKILT